MPGRGRRAPDRGAGFPVHMPEQAAHCRGGIERCLADSGASGRGEFVAGIIMHGGKIQGDEVCEGQVNGDELGAVEYSLSNEEDNLQGQVGQAGEGGILGLEGGVNGRRQVHDGWRCLV